MIIWHGTDGDIEPVECECEIFGYPNYCTILSTKKQEQMFENTHFTTKKRAWKEIVDSVKAGVSLAGRNISEAESQLKKAHEIAGNEKFRQSIF